MNRYQALQEEGNKATEYSCFVQANRETAEKLLKKVLKARKPIKQTLESYEPKRKSI
jgi:tRNA/tmRNA/rRNA uracil-C5-methylase (TrmA/RlmC/RlmD family)